MKKVVIFDFDYTLGDSSDGIIASINYALDKMGIQKPGRDKAVKTIGMSLGSTYEILSGRNSTSEKEEFELAIYYLRNILKKKQMKLWFLIRFFITVLWKCLRTFMLKG